jgi:hypothetical protein
VRKFKFHKTLNLRTQGILGGVKETSLNGTCNALLLAKPQTMRFGGKSSHNQSQVTLEIVPVLISLTVREEVAEEEVRTHEQAVILRCVIQMMFRSRPSQTSDEHIQIKAEFPFGSAKQRLS